MFEILWENAEIHFKQTEYNMDLKRLFYSIQNYRQRNALQIKDFV